MVFEKKFNEIIGRISIPSENKLWYDSFWFGCAIFLGTFLYLYLQVGELSLQVVNRAFAWTSIILIGLSFALSGICYFWDFADKYIVYRKHIGIVGFLAALLHGLISYLSLSSKVRDPLATLAAGSSFYPTLFGMLALFIFAIMIVASNQFVIHELGPKKWRLVLRFGYVGFIFAIVHFVLLELDAWNEWILLFLFGLAVIILRIVLEFAIRKKGNKEGV